MLGVNKYFSYVVIPENGSATINKGYAIYLISYVRNGHTGLYVSKTPDQVEFVAGTELYNIVFEKLEYSLKITNNNTGNLGILAIGSI